MIEEVNNNQKQRNSDLDSKDIAKSAPVPTIIPTPQSTVPPQDASTQPSTQVGQGNPPGPPQQPPPRAAQAPDHSEEHLQIDRDMLSTTRSMVKATYWGIFVAALAAAIFLAQLKTMTYQTQILGSQVEGESASASLSAVQVQRELSLTQQQVAQLEDQTKIASDTLRKSQRPWVNAESFEAKNIVLPPNGRFLIYGTLTMKNTGVSVANEGWTMMVALPNSTIELTHKWNAACEAVDTQIKAARESAKRGSADTWPIGFVLAPNQETSSMGFTIGGDFTPQELVNGFYLLGCAKYGDQFLRRHTTMFCFTPNAPVYRQDRSINTFKFQVCNGFQRAN